MVHTKEKAFECGFTGCKKRFGLKHNLKVHEKGHSGQGKPCMYCNRTFSIPVTLKHHILQHKSKNHMVSDDPEIRKSQIIKTSRGRPPTSKMDIE